MPGNEADAITDTRYRASHTELGEREKGMGLAREKDQTYNFKLSYTGKESKSRQTKALERIPMELPFQESLKLS